jgi:putative alpha-1,2-mannosidase
MGNGHTLSIRSTGTGPYVQELLFDGKDHKGSWLSLSALDQGTSKLEFKLSPEPNKQRGQPDSERPPAWVNPQK